MTLVLETIFLSLRPPRLLRTRLLYGAALRHLLCFLVIAKRFAHSTPARTTKQSRTSLVLGGHWASSTFSLGIRWKT